MTSKFFNRMTGRIGNFTFPNRGHMRDGGKALGFLIGHAIAPVPTAYELAYRYKVARETGLDEKIAKLIADKDKIKWQPHDVSNSDLNELCEIADQLRMQVSNAQNFVKQYQEDTKCIDSEVESLSSEGVSLDQIILEIRKNTKKLIEMSADFQDGLDEKNKKIQSMSNKMKAAIQDSETDFLTGLANRRSFERKLGALCERASLTDSEFCVAICDIDLFKSVNDRFGHDTGDRVIKLVSSILRDHCGAGGEAFRFGGEEFVILFEGMNAGVAYDHIDAARSDLASRNIVKRETHEALGRLSFSAGLACSAQTLDASKLLKFADLALYEAKAAGRDCVIVNGVTAH